MAIRECPHCDGAAQWMSLIDAPKGMVRRTHWVECLGCKMTGPVLDTKADAVVVWNALPRRQRSMRHNPSARAPGGGLRLEPTTQKREG